LDFISLGVKGGLSSGGVGTCKIGRGGAFSVRESATPGMLRIRGSKERHSQRVANKATCTKDDFILGRVFIDI
jgi:hypothetical protein